MPSPSNGWYVFSAGCSGFSVLRRYTPSRSRGISPSTATRSSAFHSLVCGRHGPVRYGWSSSSGSVDRNLPTTSTSMSASFDGVDDEADRGGGAAAEVQRAKGFGVL